MIGDGVADLMEAGVVNNVRKPIEPGVTITGALIGGERLYRFADRNRAIGLRDARITHGEEILAGLPSLVSINSAIEVDLTGQVNGEQAGDVYLGATGGQVDFVRAAARAATGRSIIALPASARAGAASRIVRNLSGPVTTARSEVDVVVTQYGVAQLKGRSIRDRVAAMVAIADPAFRETLDRDAHDLLKRGY
jgi:acyl-CoA hydrolase